LSGFWKPEVLFPMLLSLMIALHAHFVFSSMFWMYRYDAYLVGFAIFAAAVVLARYAPSADRSPTLARRLLPVLGMAALVIVVADVKEGVFPAGEIAGATNTYLEHYWKCRRSARESVYLRSILRPQPHCDIRWNITMGGRVAHSCIGCDFFSAAFHNYGDAPRATRRPARKA